MLRAARAPSGRAAARSRLSLVAICRCRARRCIPTSRSPTDKASRLLERIASAEGASYRAKQLVAYFGEPQSNALLDVRSSRGRTVRPRRVGTRCHAHVVARGRRRRSPGATRTCRRPRRRSCGSIRVDVLAKYDVVGRPPGGAAGDRARPARVRAPRATARSSSDGGCMRSPASCTGGRSTTRAGRSSGCRR